jgi:D-alanyl-D-alanine carboxypeptidase
MKKLSILLLLCVIALNASADIGKVFADRFQFILDSVCKKNNIKGVSAAIYIPNGGIWKGTYGESHAGVPITTDMYLPIGSNTKTFTAAIILKLAENNQLKLDDTIGTWIKNQPNISGQITIRQLLNHTSGLYNYTEDPSFFQALNADYNKVWAEDDLLQFVGTPKATAPAAWSYCNTNYLLLGMIIRDVTSKPVHQAFKDMIFTPQNFNHTFFYPQQQPQGTIPHGWADAGLGYLQDMQVDYGYTNIAFLSMATAAGAIVSTAEDNVKFWDALMTGKIINNSSLDDMRNCIKLTNTQGYGLGIMRQSNVNGRVVFDHGGTCAGYLNENLYDSLSGVCITVLSNQDSIDNNKLFTRLVMALHKATIQMPPAGVEDIASSNIAIYPNPSVDYINIETGAYGKNVKAEIYDMTGRILISQPLTNATNKVALNTLNTGLYVVRIRDNNETLYAQKIQVSK